MILVRLVISFALLGLLLWTVDPSSLSKALVTIPGANLFGATAAIAATVFPFAWRWKILSRANAIELGWSPALLATTHAYFFNQLLVSSVGGDAYRVWYLTQRQHKFSRALSCILADRLVGVFGLMVLVIIGQPVLAWWGDSETLRRLAVAISLAILTGLLTLNFLPLCQLDEQVHSRANWAASLVRALKLLRDPSSKHQLALRHGLLLAIAAQLLLCTAVWILARGLALDLPWWLVLSTFPPVYFVSLIPVTIGGWGSREAAMIGTLALVGVLTTNALALSVLFGLCMLLMGLIGGLSFVVTTTTYPNLKRPPEDNSSEQ